MTDVEVTDLSIEPGQNREYELVAVVTAEVDGPEGPLRLHRRYEALPRQNDVVEGDEVDSNDEYLDRPDEVHVHTQYATADAPGQFFLDAHDTWRPGDTAALQAGEPFLDACRDHLEADVADAYERGVAERD